MSSLTLTPTRMQEGLWRAVISQSGDGTPSVKAMHLGTEVEGVQLTERDSGTWELTVPVPASAISSGVQTVIILDASDETRIGHFTLLAGEDVGDDLLGEVALLRAELDMLKRAFRRHCVETG